MSIDVVWNVSDSVREHVEEAIRLALASQPPPSRTDAGRPLVGGAVRYTSDEYCVDRHAATAAAPAAAPSYTASLCDDADAGSAARGRGLRRCFNCGDSGHTLANCQERYDAARVRDAVQAQRASRGSGTNDTRFFETGGDAGIVAPGAAAGVLSPQLRRALGLLDDEPPSFLRRMRRFGYPPSFCAPPVTGAERHWGYADNGPMSALVAAADASYASRGVDVEAAAGGAAALVIEDDAAVVGTTDASGSGVDADTRADDAAGLFCSVPALLDARLHPLFPVCTCDRALLVRIAGLNAAFEPSENAGVASVGDGERPRSVYPRPCVSGAEDFGARGTESEAAAPGCLLHGSGGGLNKAVSSAAASVGAAASVVTATQPSTAATRSGAGEAEDAAPQLGPQVEGDADVDAAASPDQAGGRGRPAETAGRARRLSRYLVKRDSVALAALAAANADSWSAALGGSLDSTVNGIIADSLKRQPSASGARGELLSLAGGLTAGNDSDTSSV